MLDEKKGIKEAFDRVKQDIFNLGSEVLAIKQDITELKLTLESTNSLLQRLETEFISQKQPTDNPTDKLKIQTNSVIPSDNPTVPVEIGGLKDQNLDTSIGNVGVPTDRQTNQQTDKPIVNTESRSLFKGSLTQKDTFNASEILASLDSLKKEIRLKFKSMTQQEMLVFSTIYQLGEEYSEGLEYRQIANKLKLSESSIRDYTQKLISKGIPIEKIKLNNKKILLRISSKLKNLASLETIMRLREL